MNEEIKVQVGSATEPEKKSVVYSPRVEMILRKTLGGDYAIYDHYDIDIVVQPETKKILAFPKSEISDDVYAAQDRMFEFLSKKGVITRESVQAGFVYGSMQGLYPESATSANAEEVILYTLGKFLEEERPYYSHEDALENEMNKSITEPTEVDSTELGEVPQEVQKGTIPKYPAARSHYRVY